MKAGTKHTRLACIYCGCTENKACLIPREELDIVSQEAMMERAGVEHLEQLPRHISCWWVSTRPPVCSKQDCVSRFHEAKRSPRMAAKRS